MKLTKKEIKSQLEDLIKVAVDIPVLSASIEDCFDCLRFHIKYLRMDLEATKRELKVLKKQTQ